MRHGLALRQGATPGRREAAVIWSVIAAGLALRLVLAFTTRGMAFDMAAYRLVDAGLRHGLLHVYDYANRVPIPVPAWPYPPGYFPAVALAGHLAGWAGLSFNTLIRLPPIAADAALAWLVQSYLGRQGASFTARLVAVSLVAFGPSFLATSSYHGQIDAVAILPAVIAIMHWERSSSPRRAIVSGALLGIGAAIKTVPLLLVLALIPSARSTRERLQLLISAAAVPAVLLAPFVFGGGSGVRWVFHYHGGPGGGLSLLGSPDIPASALGVGHAVESPFTRALLSHGQLITGTVLALTALLLWRRRTRALPAAVLIWLVVYAFGITFFLQYMVWGLPFFLMAGYLWEVAFLELVLVPAILLVYGHPGHDWEVLSFYTVPVLVVWAVTTVATLILGSRLARGKSLGLRTWAGSPTTS